jgi:hypothetical protein
MSTLPEPELNQRALHAFERDLQQLWNERPRQWVAYHGAQQLGFAFQKHELYQECFRLGYRQGEFQIFCIEPQETEMTLGPIIVE